jgi:uncharacterized small protein (DUF1192 family)
MAVEDDNPFGQPVRKPVVHVIGQSVDDLSAPELEERILSLRAEIARLEAAIEAREATRRAAGAFFKS